MSIAPQLVEFVGASDFEISRYVGSLGFKTIVDWEYAEYDPLQPKRTEESNGAQVRLYDGRCISRNPLLYNSRVQLKEFLPDGLALALCEAEAYQRLYASKSSTPLRPDEIPVATLLGSFTADAAFGKPEFARAWSRRFPRSPVPPAPDAPFLVFRYEGNLTAARFPSSPRSDSAGGALFDKLFPAAASRRTEAYLTALMKKALEAVLYIHSAGLAHRSLSLHSLLVNTVEDRLSSSLEVKLRDFGFAKVVSEMLTTDDELSKARKAGAESPSELTAFFLSDDIEQLGWAFCELVFASLKDGDGDLPDFKLLVGDTFKLDMDQFRDYCVAEPTWERVVQFLDGVDGEGWVLLRSMFGAKENYLFTTLTELIASPLLTPVRRRRS